MQIEQRQCTKEKGWEVISSEDFKKPPQLVFVFGGRDELVLLANSRQSTYSNLLTQ